MVDPVSVTLLVGAITSIATGAGGEAGKQAWASLATMVHSAFRRDSPPDASLKALEVTPTDQHQATALAAALVDHAGKDDDFAGELRTWIDNTRYALHQGNDQTTNLIGGSAQVHGAVFQGRDFTGSIRFDTPPFLNRPD